MVRCQSNGCPWSGSDWRGRQGGLRMVAMFLKWVVFIWACSLHENSLSCTLMICTLSCIYAILQKLS